MATYIASPDEQSEDGQLRSPGARAYSDIEENTTDSLDIKPPQAKTEQHRPYKKSKEKKTSRDHKLKEHGRHRDQRPRHTGEKERDREPRELREVRDPRDPREVRDGRETRYQEVGLRPSKSLDYAGNSTNYANYDEAKYYHNREKEQYYKHQHNLQFKEFKEREPKRNDRMERVDRGATGSRKSSPAPDDKSDTLAEKVLEDLRNRLLSKKKKHESSEKPTEEYYEHKRGEREYYEKKNRPDKNYGRERKEKPITELIDSPEFNLGKSSKHHRSYDEKDMRRAKLLDAEREMAKRKEVARDELEARRIQRREREGENPNSPSPEPKRKRYASGEDEKNENEEISEEEGEQSDQQDVVMVSDHSNAEEEEIEEDSETDSESSTNSEHSAHSEHSEVEVAQISPLSVSHIMKSDHRKRTLSRSPHSKSLSRSQSRSISRSKTRSNSEHSDSEDSRSRSRSVSPAKKPEEPVKEPVKEEPKEDLLPAYFPAIQGCRSVEEFQCLNRIEEGTYGVVYRAKDKRTEEIVALKRLKMEKEKEGFPITSLREINTLLKGQHPNIVTVREIVVGSNMDKIFIVMDYVEHDLKSLMETMKHKKQVFLPGEVKCLTQQLIKAVAHLHDNWILHRDLKTSNLLLSHKGILKVGDFGLAREYGSPLKAYTSIVVTLWYRAPELLLGCKEYSTPIDIWSVGCIFAEFLSMSALFPGKSEVDQINRIFKDLGTPNERIWPGYSDLPVVQKATFTDYPVSLLRKKFAQLTSELGLDVLQKLLTYDPKQRYTADAALKHNYFKELPLPIDPAMFPTWPAKSELGLKRALASSPKPPSGGGEFKKLGADDGAENAGFTLSGAGYATYSESRQMAMGPGFSLKF